MIQLYLMIFAEHGFYDIQENENIIHVIWTGSWNLEMMEKFHWDIRSRYENRAGNPFVEIMDLRKWELTSPDVIESTVDREWNEFRVSQGLKLFILIVNSRLTETLTFKEYKEKVHIPVEIVHSHEEAMDLIKSRHPLG